MKPRLPPDWLTQADERILEILVSEGDLSPKWISDDERVDYATNYVNQRLTHLEKAGFVEKDLIGRGIYSITDEGRSYLEGEFDARDLPEPNPK